METKPTSKGIRGKVYLKTIQQHTLPLNSKDRYWLSLLFLLAIHATSISCFLFGFRMVKFVPDNRLSSSRSVLTNISKTITRYALSISLSFFMKLSYFVFCMFPVVLDGFVFISEGNYKETSTYNSFVL